MMESDSYVSVMIDGLTVSLGGRRAENSEVHICYIIYLIAALIMSNCDLMYSRENGEKAKLCIKLPN